MNATYLTASFKGSDSMEMVWMTKSNYCKMIALWFSEMYDMRDGPKARAVDFKSFTFN